MKLTFLFVCGVREVLESNSFIIKTIEGKNSIKTLLYIYIISYKTELIEFYQASNFHFLK